MTILVLILLLTIWLAFREWKLEKEVHRLLKGINQIQSALGVLPEGQPEILAKQGTTGQTEDAPPSKTKPHSRRARLYDFNRYENLIEEFKTEDPNDK